ncbi:Dyp-type peroxidase [Spirosoma sp. KUDC1026]|uniref:Dyp-type peroxidase n=1 Tax=Spirosoma sp. KUDC1026 TaxID=2745947 RepID=UPI00159B8DEA|nr:peroxidase [Spirosoma sp. KUDC1026]QKZ13626.1 peroxidase [Spirosoma sp. KUDC1026]
MPISLTATSIDPNAGEFPAMLADLQGNILKGHGRDHTINLFIKFSAGRQALVKDWLSAFTRVFVTSAKKQMEQTDFFKTNKVSAGMFVNLFLTASGYKYLGVPDGKTPQDPSFRNGMKASKTRLSDPESSTWDAGYDADIHALILIGDDSPQLVRALKRAIIISLKNLAIPLREEPGKGIRNEAGNGIEHNGYADGVSQPLFFKKDIDDEASRIGHTNWHPEAPLNLALVPDPGKAGAFGSYFVFRKLEQDVKGFKKREEELAAAIGLTGDDAERAGALVVGRFEDGTPVTSFKDALENIAKDKVPNDFMYAGDDGGKCPFHAHIRKTNPRSDGAGVDFNKSKRLVRRGIPFEKAARVRLPNGDFDPAHFPTKGDGYGLLFMCFVANLGDQFEKGQFEFMQAHWANEPNFVNTGTGIDPVIGQHKTTDVVQPQQWPTTWGQAVPTKPFVFADYVHMKGGAYFFAPSLSTLINLKVSSNPLLPETLQIFI